MEDKNELSDIVLDKEDGTKGMKLKRILVIAAVLVLLFLAVLIIMRAINTPEVEQEARLVLPPEPQSETASQASEANEDKLFQQVPIIEEEPKESFEDMVKKLKEKEMNRTAPAKETPAEEVSPPAPASTPKAQTPEVAPEPEMPTAPEPKPEPAPKPEPSANNQAASGVYIQIASVTKEMPDANYLKSVTDKNFQYTLYRTTVAQKPLTKILVGPYNSNAAAKEALSEVKEKLSPNAFIFRVP
jgi:DedD protein